MKLSRFEIENLCGHVWVHCIIIARQTTKYFRLALKMHSLTLHKSAIRNGVLISH
jgi:hypothetical protein